jgi:hypothetical protein
MNGKLGSIFRGIRIITKALAVLSACLWYLHASANAPDKNGSNKKAPKANMASKNIVEREVWSGDLNAFAAKYYESLKAGKGKNPKNVACANVTLSKRELDFKSCLEKISVKNETFFTKLLRVINNRGTVGDCATYVRRALFSSRMTTAPVFGCTGYEKAEAILDSDAGFNFIDITETLAKVVGFEGKLKRTEARNDAVLKAAQVAPPGALLSFTGDNSGRCDNGRYYSARNGGLGHFTAKAPSELYCHFKCDICPAVPHRYVDRIIIKVPFVYRHMLEENKGDLVALCAKVNSPDLKPMLSESNQVEKWFEESEVFDEEQNQ